MGAHAVFSRFPKRSEILYLRWEKQSSEALEEMRLENLEGPGVDLKERDRLAVRFNESTDSAEKLRLLELMEPYHAALHAHIKRSQAINRKLKRVEAETSRRTVRADRYRAPKRVAHGATRPHPHLLR